LLLKLFTIIILHPHAKRIEIVAGATTVMATIHLRAWLFDLLLPLVVLIQDLVLSTTLRMLSIVMKRGRKEEKGSSTT
jgi:hypothetical protein